MRQKLKLLLLSPLLLHQQLLLHVKINQTIASRTKKPANSTYNTYDLQNLKETDILNKISSKPKCNS